MAQVSKIITSLISDISQRQQDILVGRFGLSKDGEIRTLADLGEEYGITRERVRQIEADVLTLIAERVNSRADVSEIVEKSLDHLRSVGGLKREDYFVDDLKFLFDDDSLSPEQIRFLFAVSGSPTLYESDEDYFDFYYDEEPALNNAREFVKNAAKFFADKKEHLVFQNKFAPLVEELARNHKLSEFVALNYLIASKKFGVNPFNDFGLSHWEEINPKTIRSKAYLVLKKQGTPLHFRELSDLINQWSDARKRAYAQTVHNELIKDSRVVLVGRGIYALREHGYLPGTCQEIIVKVLKDKGPLSKDEIMSHISKQRILKPNTILLNLQNKKHFQRTPDGRYRLLRA